MARPKPALTQADLLHARCRRAYHLQARRAKAEGKRLSYAAADLYALALAARTCGYCAAPLALGELTWDHETPIARGGPHALSNLRVSCQRCNRLKGALTLREFLLLRELLSLLAPAAFDDVTRRLLQGAVRYRRRG